jgi:hypothetical protein
VLAFIAAVLVAGTGAMGGGSASAAKGLCKDGSPPPCRPSGGGEEAGNNLSFPVIFPDGKPSNWVEVTTWTFAPVASTAACVQEAGVPVGTAVPTSFLCYYARQNLGIDEETGERTWVPDTLRVWWLQERTQNRWQVYDPVVPTGYGPLVVTAVDVGDLLESAPLIKNKQVRTEFTLLQQVDSTLLGALGAQLWADGLYPAFGWADQPVFGAMKMSGAVPGTDQSINEIQGGDYGPGPTVGELAGTGALIDPRTVKTGTDASGVVTGYDAIVYSRGARLVIQKVTAPAGLTWDSTANEWIGVPGAVSAPIVDVGTADGTYSPEVTAGGTVVYGYNWSTQTAAALGSGTYRLTFVLDSGVGVLNTAFDASTKLVNAGESNPSTVVPAIAGGDAGIAYVDVQVQLGGGGR